MSLVFECLADKQMSGGQEESAIENYTLAYCLLTSSSYIDEELSRKIASKICDFYLKLGYFFDSLRWTKLAGSERDTLRWRKKFYGKELRKVIPASYTDVVAPSSMLVQAELLFDDPIADLIVDDPEHLLADADVDGVGSVYVPEASCCLVMGGEDENVGISIASVVVGVPSFIRHTIVSGGFLFLGVAIGIIIARRKDKN